MSCFHPSLILKYKRPEDEKFTVRYIPNKYPDEVPEYVQQQYVELSRRGNIVGLHSVPCGNCISCRMAYSRQWANRCVLESLCYDPERSYFVTLTYSDENLTFSSKSGLASLNWDDHTLFNKRLRRHMDYHFGLESIRFFTAGEYGDLNGRPHFHELLFNIDLPDKEILAHNKFGDALYTSKTLSDLWQKGMVVIGSLNWNTAAYTARYVMKKQKGINRLVYVTKGLVEPSTRMSRRPGIGVPWFEQYGHDLYQQDAVDCEGFPVFHDRIILPANGDKAMSCKPPRLFDRIASDRGLPVDQVKEMRQRVAELMDEQRRIRVMETDRSYFSSLEDISKNSNKGMFRKFQDLC